MLSINHLKNVDYKYIADNISNELMCLEINLISSLILLLIIIININTFYG